MYDIFYSISRYSRLKKVVGKIKKDGKAPSPHCLEGRPPKKRCFAFLRGTSLNHGRHSQESDDRCSGTGQILSTTSGQAAKYTPRLCSSTRETSHFSRDVISLLETFFNSVVEQQPSQRVCVRHRGWDENVSVLPSLLC